MNVVPTDPGSEPAVNAVAAVSAVLGAALLIAPSSISRLLGVDSSRTTLRAIGLVDLVLAPGLYFGRPQWPWLAARAVSNPPIAVVAAVDARSLRARLIAVGLIGATIVDVATVMRLRRNAGG